MGKQDGWRNLIMIDISDKIKTLREAKAEAVVKLSPESLKLIKEKKVEKGDVLEVSRAVAIQSTKRVGEIFPFCHNIPVEWVNVEFEFKEDKIIIRTAVKSIYRTGCEMEALFSASIAALNIYDMLKPVDKNIEILGIKLIEKSGGKSDFVEEVDKDFKAAVLVISDSVFSGKKSDKSGKLIVEKLKEAGITHIDYATVPDEIDMIRQKVLNWCESKYNLILTTGGTGASPRDVTPDAIKPIIDREFPSIMECARFYGYERTPYSMLSRGIAGLKGNTLIITLPGSYKGVKETLSAIFPYVLHIFRVIKLSSWENKC